MYKKLVYIHAFMYVCMYVCLHIISLSHYLNVSLGPKKFIFRSSSFVRRLIVSVYYYSYSYLIVLFVCFWKPIMCYR